MPQALLVTNAFWDSPQTRHLQKELLRAAQGLGLDLQPRTNADFMQPHSAQQAPPKVLFWDKDIRLAMRLEAAGARLYNPAAAIALCDDKTLTWLALQNSGIAMPQTILAPATFPAAGYPALHFVQEAADILGLPLIIKEGCGSFGQQVYLAQNVQEACAIVRQIGAKPFLFQQFIAESAGMDIRIYVVGGQVAACMKRLGAAGDFRANITGGGRAQSHVPTHQQADMAVQACRQLGLDFAGVDLLLGRDGPLLCEVNSNAHFAALADISGVDIAQGIIAHLMRDTL